MIMAYAAFSGWMADILEKFNDPDYVQGTPYQAFQTEIDGLVHVMVQIQSISQDIATKIMSEILERAGFHQTLNQAQEDMQA